MLEAAPSKQRHLRMPPSAWADLKLGWAAASADLRRLVARPCCARDAPGRRPNLKLVYFPSPSPTARLPRPTDSPTQHAVTSLW